jgi:hypothetical protein
MQLLFVGKTEVTVTWNPHILYENWMKILIEKLPVCQDKHSLMCRGTLLKGTGPALGWKVGNWSIFSDKWNPNGIMHMW